MKKIKAFLRCTLTIGVMLLGICIITPTQAFTEAKSKEVFGKTLAYIKVDENKDGKYDAVYISGVKSDVTKVTIPSKMEGLSVLGISANFAGFEELPTMYVKRSLGYYNNLKSIKLENGIKSVGEDTFLDCTNLTQAVLPDSVTTIEKS